MPFRWPFVRRDITEASTSARPKVPEREGFVQGIPPGGMDEHQAGLGAATQTDRKSEMGELWEAYLACPWSWAAVNAIARTITAGGLVTDWNADTGEGEQAPDKPEPVLALERLLEFCNPAQDIRQLLRNVVADLQVFGDAYIEVTWWGNTPVALYNLDAPTTTPIADEHGVISGYVQISDFGQRADFDEREVIHISLDSARPGVLGVSPTHAAMLPIQGWLFAAATGKYMFRKGLPPNVHVDFPASMSNNEVKRWRGQYATQNLGPSAIGMPLTTKGGGKVAEMQPGKVTDVIDYKKQCRDEILSCYGVPPAKAGVIESGNLGGGTGTTQDKTFHIDTCMPIAELILEKLNFALAVNGFGVDGWRLKFRDVDYRDDETIEKIRDMRLRNGAWILNKYRADISEPAVDGGDEPVLVDRENLVLWSDMAAMSKAMIAGRGRTPGVVAGETPPGGEPMQPGQQPGQPPAESLRVVQIAAYRKRLREAIQRMPLTESKGAKSTAQQVYGQLLKDFPPKAIKWVLDPDVVKWEGPARVPEDQIDMAHREQWNASHEPGQVAVFRARLRRKKAKGKHLKPVILIRPKGSDKDVIADGHHRVLATLAEGEEPWAYVGRVKKATGPWDMLALSEKPEVKAA